MPPSSRRPPSAKTWLAIGAAATLAAAPALMAGGLGRFIGGLWVSTMALIAGLFGGVLGG